MYNFMKTDIIKSDKVRDMNLTSINPKLYTLQSVCLYSLAITDTIITNPILTK